MNGIINIYCDESCHLENDNIPVMVLGAIYCPLKSRLRIAKEIRKIKVKHGLPPTFEIKWTKVSETKKEFYLELVDYFFAEKDLRFRAVVIPDKSKLEHSKFGHTHDVFYYKMYYQLLTVIFENGNQYRVYLDIKDTQGQKKVMKLKDILRSAHYDFDKEKMIQRLQQIHSHESEQLQIADLLIGALSYKGRKLESNSGKMAVIQSIKNHTGLSLEQSTLPSAKKFNLFVWEAKAL